MVNPRGQNSGHGGFRGRGGPAGAGRGCDGDSDVLKLRGAGCGGVRVSVTSWIWRASQQLFSKLIIWLRRIDSQPRLRPHLYSVQKP